MVVVARPPVGTSQAPLRPFNSTMVVVALDRVGRPDLVVRPFNSTIVVVAQPADIYLVPHFLAFNSTIVVVAPSIASATNDASDFQFHHSGGCTPSFALQSAPGSSFQFHHGGGCTVSPWASTSFQFHHGGGCTPALPRSFPPSLLPAGSAVMPLPHIKADFGGPREPPTAGAVGSLPAFRSERVYQQRQLRVAPVLSYRRVPLDKPA